VLPVVVVVVGIEVRVSGRPALLVALIMEEEEEEEEEVEAADDFRW
jgi:hypothetical protein